MALAADGRPRRAVPGPAAVVRVRGLRPRRHAAAERPARARRGRRSGPRRPVVVLANGAGRSRSPGGSTTLRPCWSAGSAGRPPAAPWPTCCRGGHPVRQARRDDPTAPGGQPVVPQLPGRRRESCATARASSSATAATTPSAGRGLPFGFGLSYTTFEVIGVPTCPSAGRRRWRPARRGQCAVTNTGDVPVPRSCRSTSATPSPASPGPSASCKGVRPGRARPRRATAGVRVELEHARLLVLVDALGRWVVEAGEFDLTSAPRHATSSHAQSIDARRPVDRATADARLDPARVAGRPARSRAARGSRQRLSSCGSCARQRRRHHADVDPCQLRDGRARPSGSGRPGRKAPAHELSCRPGISQPIRSARSRTSCDPVVLVREVLRTGRRGHHLAGRTPHRRPPRRTYAAPATTSQDPTVGRGTVSELDPVGPESVGVVVLRVHPVPVSPLRPTLACTSRDVRY